MLKPITSIEVVEIVLKDTINKKYYLPELLQVRGKKIKYIIVQPSFLNAAPSGNALANATVLNNCYLTLVSNAKEEVNNYPLNFLMPVANNANESLNEKPIEINKVINWPKSYISISNTSSITPTTTSIVLYVLYENVKLLPTPAEKAKLDILHVDYIEFATPQGSKKTFNFPDNEKLRNKRIIGIEFTSSLTATTSPNGYSVNQAGFVTLNVKGTEEVHKFMADLFARPHYGISRISFNHINIDWPKSYIELVNAPGSANLGIYCIVYYKD